MTRTFRRGLPAFSLAAALLTGAACGEDDAGVERARRAASDGGEIVVAAPWSWEARGGEILYGEGMDLAVEEINAGGGVGGRRLRVLRVDDRESVEEGRLVAQELGKNPEVAAVVGHLHSYVTVPAAAVYDLAGLPLLAPTATTDELTERGYTRVFRTVFSDAEAGRQLAAYALARGWRRVVIYYARNEYGRGLANAFEEHAASHGGSVVSRESYDPGLSANPHDAEVTVADWGTFDFDAVFVAGHDRQAALLISELRRRGIGAPVLGSDALATPTFLRLGGAAVGGTVIASAFHPADPSAEVRRFVAAFRTRWGKDPDVGAALAYDAVHVLAEGIRRAGSPDPAKLSAALHALRDVRGVTGTFSFDARGNLTGSTVGKVVVRGGAFHPLPASPVPPSSSRDSASR